MAFVRVHFKEFDCFRAQETNQNALNEGVVRQIF